MSLESEATSLQSINRHPCHVVAPPRLQPFVESVRQ
jgi:hypothetical protein